MNPEPIPTRCDCRFHDDGTTTTCGVHSPLPLMYYEPEETL